MITPALKASGRTGRMFVTACDVGWLCLSAFPQSMYSTCAQLIASSIVFRPAIFFSRLLLGFTVVV